MRRTDHPAQLRRLRASDARLGPRRGGAERANGRRTVHCEREA
jgi:hypothetical protein